MTRPFSPINLKFILFDFGGVIASEGFQHGILNLARLFGIDYDRMYDIVSRKAAFESGYSSGKSDERRFWDTVAALLRTENDLRPLRYHILDNFVPRKEILDAVASLKKKYQTGIFSDQTNWIHEIDGIYRFFPLFDHHFVSYDCGYTKYDDRFYRLVEERTPFSGSEILLVDDKERVLDRARSLCGWQTYLFTSIANFRDFLDNLLQQKSENGSDKGGV